jgi:hypothetical protein
MSIFGTAKDPIVLNLIKEYIKVLSEPPPPGKITGAKQIK